MDPAKKLVSNLSTVMDHMPPDLRIEAANAMITVAVYVYREFGFDDSFILEQIGAVMKEVPHARIGLGDNPEG